MVCHSTATLVLVAILAVIQLDVCSAQELTLGEHLENLGVSDEPHLSESLCRNNGGAGFAGRGTGVKLGDDGACDLCYWDLDARPADCINGGFRVDSSADCLFDRMTVCLPNEHPLNTATDRILCCDETAGIECVIDGINECCSDDDCNDDCSDDYRFGDDGCISLSCGYQIVHNPEGSNRILACSR